jgi:hypothetical protein
MTDFSARTEAQRIASSIFEKKKLQSLEHPPSSASRAGPSQHIVRRTSPAWSPHRPHGPVREWTRVDARNIPANSDARRYYQEDRDPREELAYLLPNSQGVSKVPKARVKWTLSEVNALERGLVKYHNEWDKWAKIKNDPELKMALHRRSNVDLKDKVSLWGFFHLTDFFRRSRRRMSLSDDSKIMNKLVFSRLSHRSHSDSCIINIVSLVSSLCLL